MRILNFVVFLIVLAIWGTSTISTGVAEDNQFVLECPTDLNVTNNWWTEAFANSNRKQIGILNGHTINHIPVSGEITTLKIAEDFVNAESLIQAHLSDSVRKEPEENALLPRLIEKFSSDNGSNGDHYSVQKDLQVYSIITKFSEYKDYEFSSEIGNQILGTPEFATTPKVGCPIEGKLQFEAYDNFGQRHSTTYNLTGIAYKDLIFLDGMNSNQPNWGKLTAMMKTTDDSQFSGIWSLTGNSEISLPSIKGVASVELGEGIKVLNDWFQNHGYENTIKSARN